MPFKSEKQRKYLWANEPEIARDWTDTYGSGIAKALGGRIQYQGGGPGPGGQGARGQATQNPGRSAPSRPSGPPGGGATSLGSGRDVGAGHAHPGIGSTYSTPSITSTPTPGDGGIGDKFRNWGVGGHKKLGYQNLGWMDSSPHPLLSATKHIPAHLKNMTEDDYNEWMRVTKLNPNEMPRTIGDVNKFKRGEDIMERVFEWESGPQTQSEYERLFGKEPPPDTGGGEGQPWLWPPYGMASAPVEEEVVEDEVIDPYAGSYRVPEQYRLAAEGGRIPAAFGGIMDTYSGRRKYGFGSFFKKITKPIKKIVKSPLGKAAMMAGLGYLATPGAGAAAKGGWWKNLLLGKLKHPGGPPNQMMTRSGGLLGMLKNPWVSIPAASAAAGLYTAMKPPEELESATGEWDEDKAWWDNYLASLGEDNYRVPTEYRRAEGGRIGRQEGGLMDLGGMEKDYRNDGGFVPIGGQEKADDVPARLSRNEFVFTADAVRNAGGGDIDRGAEVMENVMKNLEAGGKVSEESQGKGGAQEMFEVSERLSEVM